MAAARATWAQRLQRAYGNQAVQRLVAPRQSASAHQRRSDHHVRPSQASADRPALQRIVIAVGDLRDLAQQEKTGKRPPASEAEKREASVITQAAEARLANSLVNGQPERRADPWDERFRPFKAGPLASIGSEEIRIYGHGASRPGAEVVTRVGDYTPEALAERLVEMGLSKTYSGEIYLTGCNTARGDNDGYLGEFFKVIVTHCPGVRVRGNLATSTTFDDGTQGVWNGLFTSKEELDGEVERRKGNVGEMVEEAKKDGERTTGGLEAIQDPALMTSFMGFLSERHGLRTDKMRAQMKIGADLTRAAYSTDGSLTRTLPRGADPGERQSPGVERQGNEESSRPTAAAAARSSSDD